MLGKNLKRFREQQGYTQETLAKASGIGEKYISAIENGKRDAGKHTIAKLCDVLMIDELTLRFGERQLPVSKSDDLRLLEQEIATLSPDELLQVRLLLRKWRQDKLLGV